MPFGKIDQNWQLSVKTSHEFRLYVKENTFIDRVKLYVDDVLVAKGIASLWNLKDYSLFDVDGRTLELRWVWKRTGDPISILIMHKGRILAQYGSDRAAKDDYFEE